MILAVSVALKNGTIRRLHFTKIALYYNLTFLTTAYKDLRNLKG